MVFLPKIFLKVFLKQMRFDLPPVLFKLEIPFILMRNCHITHQLNKRWKLKLTITCYCIFETKGNL